MSTTAIAVVVVVVVVVVLLFVGLSLVMTRRRRGRRQLQEQFGPEYERAVADTGDPKQAEAELRDRVHRRDQLELRPLSNIDRDRYIQEWRQIQVQFVDQPRESLASADRLVNTVMRESGYPLDDFDSRAALISVDHPEVVAHYRSAQRVNLAAQAAGQVSTEDVRQAVVSYRWLFSALLGSTETADQGAVRPR